MGKYRIDKQQINISAGGKLQFDFRSTSDVKTLFIDHYVDQKSCGPPTLPVKLTCSFNALNYSYDTMPEVLQRTAD